MAELSRRAFLVLAAAVPFARLRKPTRRSYGSGPFGSGPFGS